MTMPADRERDRRSLQDLAKMALTPPPPSAKSVPSGVQRAAEAKKDDSGIVDLAAAAASDPVAPVRAQQTPLASQGLFDDEPASVRPPPSAQQPVPSMPPIPASSMPPVSQSSQPIAPISQAATSSQVAPIAAAPAKKKSGSGAVIALVLGGFVAVSAAAAGTFVVMKHRAREHLASLSTPTTQPAQPVVTAATPATPAPEATGTVAAPADPTPATDDSNGKVATAAKGTFKGAPKTVANPGAQAAPPAPKPEEPAKVTQNELPKPDNTPPGDLGKAMAGAVGPKNDQVPAAGQSGGTSQFAAGSVPTKPSQGAVTGALGAVLPGARACLGPDDPISRAVVVFGSNGSVQSVSVSGGAAGKPAEGCIKGALSKAKVAPFAEATYSAPVTIRH